LISVTPSSFFVVLFFVNPIRPSLFCLPGAPPFTSSSLVRVRWNVLFFFFDNWNVCGFFYPSPFFSRIRHPAHTHTHTVITTGWVTVAMLSVMILFFFLLTCILLENNAKVATPLIEKERRERSIDAVKSSWNHVEKYLQGNGE
jgi:hypothetical protein